MSFNQNTKINNLYQLILDVSNNIIPPSGFVTNPLTSNLDADNYNLTNLGNLSGTNIKVNASTIALGDTAGSVGQQFGSIALGVNAGKNNQQADSISIGDGSGTYNQQNQSIAVGFLSGNQAQQTNSVAIGSYAGTDTQGANSIAIGFNAGASNQVGNGIAIGKEAGKLFQGQFATAIGYEAGKNNQGLHCVAIGSLAGNVGQPDNSIVINASGSALNGATQNACYINPIRNVAGTKTLVYNPSNSEVTYGTPPITNILSQYSTTSVSINSSLPAGANTTTTANFIQRLLAGGTYLHSQPSMGATLDAVNGRYNITETGKFRVQVNTAVLSTGSTGTFRIEIAIDGTQYSNSPTNTILWCWSDVSTTNTVYNGVSLDFHCGLNAGQNISVLCIQPVASSATSYLMSNGSTISITRIE